MDSEVGFVGSGGFGVSHKARCKTCKRVRMCEEAGEADDAKPRIRKEIYDGFKTDKYVGFEKKGMGSRFEMDMRPNEIRGDDKCGDCDGKGNRVCLECNGRPYYDNVSGEPIYCDGCGGKPVVCSTCGGKGVRPGLLEGKWWNRLPSFFK
ncbi:hypothetical protein NDN08_007934 [Rhodosorus marinus]|uniref:CR-type domain-containing protein n=1 Tax=Rhodosorus marinus TaxID=101924 RepID=A0AAV8UYZ3_9RHOD|nr:hypothetical protein NDN08_007934 [Rhodosorus marinus]